MSDQGSEGVCNKPNNQPLHAEGNRESMGNSLSALQFWQTSLVGRHYPGGVPGWLQVQAAPTIESSQE
jgi:hypothetical protein